MRYVAPFTFMVKPLYRFSVILSSCESAMPRFFLIVLGIDFRKATQNNFNLSPKPFPKLIIRNLSVLSFINPVKDGISKQQNQRQPLKLFMLMNSKSELAMPKIIKLNVPRESWKDPTSLESAG